MIFCIFGGKISPGDAFKVFFPLWTLIVRVWAVLLELWWCCDVIAVPAWLTVWVYRGRGTWLFHWPSYVTHHYTAFIAEGGGTTMGSVVPPDVQHHVRLQARTDGRPFKRVSPWHWLILNLASGGGNRYYRGALPVCLRRNARDGWLWNQMHKNRLQIFRNSHQSVFHALKSRLFFYIHIIVFVASQNNN